MRSIDRANRIFALALAALASVAPAPYALDRSTSRISSKDTTKPTGRTRLIDFTVSEATNMSLSVTPDSEWIVFDLLSNIYRLPMDGGEAECLTANSGMALNFQPRVSPDGKLIAFISDRTGQNNLWVMDIDGSNPRPLYQDPMSRAFEPMWTSDGQAVMVRQSGAIMKYPTAGGSPSEVYKGVSFVSSTANGKYLYFQVNVPTNYGWTGAGSTDPMAGTAEVRRLTLADGSVSQIIAGGTSQGNQRFASGGGVAPQVSPDGRWLAFARRIPDATFSYKGHKMGPRNALWIKDLANGEEHIVADPIEQDTGASLTRMTLPGYSWTADSRYILISSGGRIAKVDVAAKTKTAVPFTARVRRVISLRERVQCV